MLIFSAEQYYKWIEFVRIMELKDELENRFSYHAPKPGQPEVYQQIRDKAKELAYLIVELTPHSREQSTSITHLDSVVFFANAAIARNG